MAQLVKDKRVGRRIIMQSWLGKEIDPQALAQYGHPFQQKVPSTDSSPIRDNKDSRKD